MATTTTTLQDDAATTMTSEGETATIYQELLSFISSPRNDLQKAASEATLAALTPSTNSSSNNEAAQSLTTLNVIRPLCKIASISSQQSAGSNDALCALNILCSHQLVGNQCILDFLDCRGIGRCIELALSNPPTPPSTAASISALNNNNTESEDSAAENNSEESKISKEWNEWRKQVNYACALLANATRDEKGAVEFIGQSFPNEAIPSSFMQNGEEEKVENDMKDTTKPTAMLLLSRFLNPLFIDTSSLAYKATMEAWEKNSLSVDEQQQNQNNTNDDFDEYDAFDQEDTHTNEATIELQKAKQSITMDMNEHYDPYQHIAAVIMNITQLEIGRKFLMKIIHSTKKSGGDSRKSDSDETSSHLQSLLPQLSSPNTTRRQGIAGTLKNCCFATDSIWWLLNVVNMDKSLLMTLAGPEELTIEEKIGLDPDYWLLGPQKVREPNVLVRLYVVEAILLLLASGRRTRETLRERRTYVIIKLADMVEESEEVSERLLECVQYLRRDEEGTEEGSSDKRAYETYARGMLEMDGAKNSKALLQLPPSTTTAAAASGGKGDDEEDYENID